MTDREHTPGKNAARVGETKPARGGYFGRCFRQEEIRDLNAHPLSSLDEGIDLLRVAARRFLEMAEPENTAEWVKWLNAVSLVGARLGKLLHLRKELGQGDDEVGRAISEALSEVMAELKIGKHV
jgi:hypothetical protein